MIRLVTDFPVAVDSNDHINPKGTAIDNLSSPKFVEAILNKFGKELHYCDLGTAGGKLVTEFEGAGAEIAVGIDGSDHCYNAKKNAWSDENKDRILFTADISKPFHFENENGENILFNLFTSFDVLEHISKEGLVQVLKNVHDSLFSGGYFLSSIADFPDEGYHVTLENKDWWIEFFEANGFVHEEIIDDSEYARRSSFNLTFRKI